MNKSFGLSQSSLFFCRHIFALAILGLSIFSVSAFADAPLTYRGTFSVRQLPIAAGSCAAGQEQVAERCATSAMQSLGFAQIGSWQSDSIPCGADGSLECAVGGFEQNGNSGNSYTGLVELVCANGGSPMLPSGQKVQGWCELPGTVPPCEAGQSRNPQTQECISPGVRNAGCPKCKQNQGGSSVGDPVNPAYGNTYETVVDYLGAGPFPLKFTRSYSSSSANDTTSSGVEADAQVGKGWMSNIATHMTQDYPLEQCPHDPTYVCPVAGTFYTMWRPDGSQDKFQIGNDTWPTCVCGIPASGPTAQGMLSFNNFLTTGVPFIFTRGDGYIESYDIQGRLFQVQDPHGLTQTYSYSYNTIGGVQILQSITVTDPESRQIVLNYDANADANEGRLMSLTIPSDGGSGIPTTTNIYYQYDSIGNLISVTYPDDIHTGGYSVTYRYDDTAYPHALTGIIDESNTGSSAEYAVWSYDDTTGKVICAANGGTVGTRCDADPNVVNKVSLAYSGNVSTVTEATGLVRNLSYTTINDVNVLSSVDRRCVDCGDTSKSIGYGSQGQPNKIIDFNNHEVDPYYDEYGTIGLQYESVDNPSYERFTVNWFYAGSGVGATPFPSRTWVYDSNSQPIIYTSYCYNSNNGTCNDTTQGMGPVWTKTISDPVNTSISSRTFTYTYGSTGLLASVAGPRIVGGNPVTTSYSYFTSNSGGNRIGDLHKITDAAGNLTTVGAYEPTGRPGSIVDPNGVDTLITFDERQRLTATSVKSSDGSSTESTTYTYYPNGLLQQIVFPDNSFYTYNYDNAHRLTSVKDADQNKTTYTYTVDTAAKTYTIEEQRFDSNGTLRYDHKHIRDDLQDQVRDVDGDGNVTIYQHDANGNVVSIIDPNGNNTQQKFDPLERMYAVVDANGNTTNYNYDALDHLTDITGPSPRGLDTHYVHDAYGDLLQQVSPDTGTTNYSYDGGGDLATKVDANGYTMTNIYDILSRLTKTTYKDVGGTVRATNTYTYDQTGSNGFTNIGYLTGMTDASGSTSFTYDSWGNTYQKQSTIAGVLISVNYRYDNANRLQTIWYGTFPNSQQIRYAYDSAGQLTEVDAHNSSTTYALASNITHAPFGPIENLPYGNGVTETRSYYPSYRLKRILASGIQDWTYVYDAAGNAISITDGLNTGSQSFSQTFNYDSLNRLFQAQGAYGSLSIGTGPNNSFYDSDGNRTQLTLNGITTTYGIDPASEKLISTTTNGATLPYSYSATGNITSNGIVGFVYNTTNRMKSATGASGSTGSYTYNALGQRAEKIVAGVATLYMYDEQGHLAAELGSDGTVQEVHVWIGDRPIAYYGGGVGGASSAKYIYSDAINTPRLITNSSATLGWTWHSDPFGNGSPNVIIFGGNFNLRMLGQYFDAESGENYNYFRDYDSTTGRYIQSDPVGLKGGINSYVYALNSPLTYDDPFGLYSPGNHQAFTQEGAEMAGLSATSAASLANDVVNVDYLPGSQDTPDAVMHAMCPGAYSTPECAEDFMKYEKYQLNKCTVQGLAKALHALQDSFARGHAGFQPYAGLLSVSGLHVYYDFFPTDLENQLVPQVTKDIIGQFEKNCSCSL